MQKKLMIIGAGGHGRLIAGMAKKTNKFSGIVFSDDADITICHICTTGVGVLVVKNIARQDVYKGVPAMKKEFTDTFICKKLKLFSSQRRSERVVAA